MGRAAPARNGGTMSHKAVRSRGFTLVELLIVISIIALLVSLLVPYFNLARQLAVRSQCQANQKAIGEAVGIFANQFSGRGPGYSVFHGYGWPESDANDTWGASQGWTMSWTSMLNKFSFGGEYRCQVHGYMPSGKTSLYCPAWEFWGSLYPRLYVMNEYVCSAWNWGSNGPGDPDGLRLDTSRFFPQPRNPQTGAAVPRSAGDFFTLGAILANFPQPSYEFLIVESEVGNEYMRAQLNQAPYAVPLAGDRDAYGISWPSSQWVYQSPPWTSAFDNPYYKPGEAISCSNQPYDTLAYAFRHTRPSDLAMYQRQCTANFLFIDGHVEGMNANERIDSDSRYNYHAR